MQAVESYRLWPEGPGFKSRSPRIAQARVRLAPQTPHRAGALCTGYALLVLIYSVHSAALCFSGDSYGKLLLVLELVG